MAQESGHSLARYLWLKFSHKVIVKLLTGTAVSSEDLTAAGEATSKLTHMIIGKPYFHSGCWLEAVAGCIICPKKICSSSNSWYL